jgi:DNA segregation ATPase FtsK/SpoIIIE, S-DNA-T family
MRLPPAYKGSDPYVFVSYSHKDSDEVLKDISWMIENGYRVWYDEGIEFGQDFPTELAIAIKRCSQFIVYLSPNSIESKYVNREINYAINLDLKIYPIFLIEVNLSERLDFLLSTLQRLYRFQYEWNEFSDYFEKGLVKDCKVIVHSSKVAGSNSTRKEKTINEIKPARMLSQVDLKNKQLATKEPVLEALATLDIIVELVDKVQGSTTTLYELEPISGALVSRMKKIEIELALLLGVNNAIIYPHARGESTIKIEIPNKNRSIVPIRSLLEANEYINASSPLTIALGDDVTGQHYYADIAELPHVLIGGKTGSGKTMFLYSMIISLLYKTTPDELKLILIDPKAAAFDQFKFLPHLLAPIITDPHGAVSILNWATNEFQSRYQLFADNGVCNLKEYNALDHQDQKKLPSIIIIIDELADLIMVAPQKVEESIIRIAQLGRAAGIHLIIATQRPYVDTISGNMRANIPTRIAFEVNSAIESRMILNKNGAEKLLGSGDMIYQPLNRMNPIRLQGCFASNKDIEAVMEFVCNQFNGPDFLYDLTNDITVNHLDEASSHWDPMLIRAVKFGMNSGQISTSAIQRRLRIGYAHAARIIDEMDENHIVSKFDGNKARTILITKEQFEEIFGSQDTLQT